MKLATLRVEEKEFNEKTYQPVVEETGGSKAPSKESERVYENPGSVIRWRYGEQVPPFVDEDIPSAELGTYQAEFREIESNARIVQWSDGSYQIALGKQLFDFRFESGNTVKLFTKLGDYLVSKNEVDRKVFLIPAEGSEQYDTEDYVKVAKELKKKKAETLKGEHHSEGELSISSNSDA
eukprot:TRINITY_DN4220_c0_g2_i8.p1 TRINITY_DN4220_c0_g2~~TRINITY_DN4220_c0_g2_i8.p1  ORF type:complete len:180 (+),score=58.04 TRINITY_DN4220_c0_g2_i8:251-790(+)